MEIIGYIAAVLMGATLGIIGGGGSILTVPILVYLMGVPPMIATGYSLLIVGSTAAFGAYRYSKYKNINFKAAISFAIPSMLVVYFTRLLLLPLIPNPVISYPVILEKDTFIMILFAILMSVSAIMMLNRSKDLKIPILKEQSYLKISLYAVAIGITTGILGAGGGFLILPALVLLLGIPIKDAVGASLVIIAINSLSGFIGDLQRGTSLQLILLSIMILCTFSGIWLGTLLHDHLDEKKLQQFFAYFTLSIAGIIFLSVSNINPYKF